jgi:16S rRNA (guanine1207-N2)-methyltransferase
MEYKLQVNLRGDFFVFYTASGLFSPRRIDPGTRLLAEHMILRSDDKLLDMGCGYGVLGIVASRYVREVHMVDVDKKALHYARLNARLNGANNVKIYRSDLFSNVTDVDFTNIVSNPPISSGKRVLERFFREAKDHLVEDGLLQVVLRRGQQSYYRLLQQLYRETWVAKKKAGYWVIVARK